MWIVFIKYLGSDYLGFSGLFTSIMSMLALAELGLGGAIVYNLYKPIHDNDKGKIASLTRFYRIIYLGIAGTVFALGMTLMPFLQFFIKDLQAIPFSIGYIRLIYFLSLLESVSSYLLVYKTTLLTVSQREYVITNVNTITQVLLAVARFFVLIVTKNYVIYLMIGMVFRVAGNYIASRYAMKHFPYLKDKEYRQLRISKEEKRSVLKNARNLSIHTLAAYVVNSTDSLIISTFVGITELGLYSNYGLIFSTIRSLISTIVGSIQAPLGDLVTSGNKSRVKEVVELSTYAFFVLSSFCGISLAVLSSSVIRILFGESYIMGVDLVLVCSINVFVWTMTRPIWKLSAVTGLFEEDRVNAILEAVVNAVTSVIAVQFWGITGTFAGTMCSYIVAFIFKTRLQFQRYFLESPKKYFILIIKYCLLFLLELYVVIGVTGFIDSIFSVSMYICFAVKCFLCLIIPNGINYLLFFRTPENKYFVYLLRRKLLRAR